MANVTIFHNPACGTSQSALALIRERGIEPRIVEYLKTPPTLEELKEMVHRSGLGARDFMRSRERLYEELDLGNPKWTEDQLIEFIAESPALLNRPIVSTPKGIRLYRPPETVLELLD